MQDNLKTQKKSLLRKIGIIAFLPIIITIWMTGWVLTQIGSQGEPSKINQETLLTHPGFKTYEKRSEVPDEESREINEPQIVA